MNNIRFQGWVLTAGVSIAIVKFVLYYLTTSNTIFSDALESIVNIIASTITLYSLYLASKPRDKNHPYGHGKIEFIASGIEGGLLFGAGILTIYKTISDYFDNQDPQLNGFILGMVVLLGFINYFVGRISVDRGIKTNSPSLIAGGEHLKTDGYTSFGILLGLILIYLSHWNWLDTLVAIVAGMYMIYQGFIVLKRSLLDIIDTADEAMLEKIISYMQLNRDEHMIDIHNFRLIKYGSDYHIDAHLTLPYYYTNREVHREMKEVHVMINDHFGSEVEIFIHPDPCEPFCCHYCQIKDCKVRSSPFQKEIVWTLDNVLKNEKHGSYVD